MKSSKSDIMVGSVTVDPEIGAQEVVRHTPTDRLTQLYVKKYSATMFLYHFVYSYIKVVRNFRSQNKGRGTKHFPDV